MNEAKQQRKKNLNLPWIVCLRRSPRIAPVWPTSPPLTEVAFQAGVRNETPALKSLFVLQMCEGMCICGGCYRQFALCFKKQTGGRRKKTIHWNTREKESSVFISPYFDASTERVARFPTNVACVCAREFAFGRWLLVKNLCRRENVPFARAIWSGRRAVCGRARRWSEVWEKTWTQGKIRHRIGKRKGAAKRAVRMWSRNRAEPNRFSIRFRLCVSLASHHPRCGYPHCEKRFSTHIACMFVCVSMVGLFRCFPRNILRMGPIR